MSKQCYGEGLVFLRNAAEAVAADPDAFELYQEWKQLRSAEDTSTTAWLNWEQALERSEVLATYFSLLRQNHAPNQNGQSCADGCCGCGA